MNSNDTAKTPRDPLDFYPTPLEVTGTFRDWLSLQPGAPGLEDSFLDPAGGEGHIVKAMRDVWGEAFWHAIEIDTARAKSLERVCENVIVGDLRNVKWPAAHVVANPPFSVLDETWQAAARHRAEHGVWCAVFTPVAWWSAEKRRDYVRPDFLLALGWRPVFRRQMGAGHKGSQDFAWAVLSPAAQPNTIWKRFERQRAA